MKKQENVVANEEVNNFNNNKGMYKTPTMQKTSIEVNESTEGATIEQKIERLTINKGKIEDGEQKSPLIFQERKSGINKAYNIRTDRWEIAVEAGDKIAASYAARRDETPQVAIDKKDDKVESTHGKGEDTTE